MRSAPTPISILISLAAAAERPASERTAEATTAKPRPCSSARAETVFFYTQDAKRLLDAIGALASHLPLRTVHRPANLDDLFLKHTGRQELIQCTLGPTRF